MYNSLQGALPAVIAAAVTAVLLSDNFTNIRLKTLRLLLDWKFSGSFFDNAALLL